VIFYTIFTVFYTTFFTNGQGFFTGLVGGLGYWLSQQSVNRGEQPIYFYALIQIPMYEYLPAIGTIVATVIAAKKKLFSTLPGIAPAQQIEPTRPAIQLPLTLEDADSSSEINQPLKLPVMALFLYWSIMSLAAYSVAGEKMPWLTVHIALPMILAAAWGFGYLVDAFIAGAFESQGHSGHAVVSSIPSQPGLSDAGSVERQSTVHGN